MKHHLNIIEIDNFFPVILQKELYQLFHKEDPKWVLKEIVTGKNTVKQWQEHNDVKDATAFTWVVNDNTKEFEFISKNVKHFIEQKTDYKVEKFGRILFGYVPPDPSYDHEKYHMTPHVDHDNQGDWKNFLYYLNDNDASTIFFNQIFKKNVPENYAKQEIVYKIKPVKNKAVIFDRSIYHAGSVSNTNKRMILSIHFLVK